MLERDDGEKPTENNYEVVGNGSGCNGKPDGRFSNRVKGFGCLGSIVRENKGIAVSRIRYDEKRQTEVLCGK